MPIQTSDLRWHFSGGGSNVDPAASLGGSPGGAVPDASVSALFDDVSRDEIIAGDTEYRCVYVYNNHGSLDLENARIFVESNTPYDRTNIRLAFDPAGIDGIAGTVSGEGTRPAGGLHVVDRRVSPIVAQNTLSSLFVSHGGARLHQAFGNDIHSYMMSADRRSVSGQGTERDLGNNFPRDIEGASELGSTGSGIILAGGTPGEGHWRVTTINDDGSLGVFQTVTWNASHAPAAVSAITGRPGTRIAAVGTDNRLYTWTYTAGTRTISGSVSPVQLAYPVAAMAYDFDSNPVARRLFMLRETDGMLISWAWNPTNGEISDELHHGHPFGSTQITHAGMTLLTSDPDVLVLQRRGGSHNEMVSYLASANDDLIEFSAAPDYDHGLDVGTLQSSQGIAVWVERKVLPTPQGTGYDDDGATLRLAGETPP